MTEILGRYKLPPLKGFRPRNYQVRKVIESINFPKIHS